jgi:D-sedoheptulose 7-phosphate isomerase
MNVKEFVFLGSGGGKALDLCDEAFIVQSDITSKIQEAHLTAGHALMECIEYSMLESGYLHLRV